MVGIDTGDRRRWTAWLAIATTLLGLAGLLVANRHRYDWALELEQIPALPLMAGLVTAGIAYTFLLPLLNATARGNAPDSRGHLTFIIAVGLALRLMMFATEPALEDDQQRYLFEGALWAHGISPYRVSPQDAKVADRATSLGRIADHAGPVLERINHAKLKTIYPPVAETAFAIAYLLKPFSLTAWRLVLLAADCGTLAMLLLLLRDIGRSAAWIALYWWNPIVVKEVFNSAHMEGVLALFLVAAVFLAVRQRHLLASAALGLAIGVKIWPLLLAPLLLRPLLSRPKQLAACAALIGVLCLLWTWPIVAGGLDERSGFVAYAQRWQANGAALPALRGLIGNVFGVSVETAGRAARLLLAAVAGLVALFAARRPIETCDDFLQRAAIVTLVVSLTSPAQFPWYMIWTLPFVVFAPRLGGVAMAVFLPLYYTSFYFSAIDAYPVFRDRVVWVIWLPVWALLAFEAGRRWHRPENKEIHAQ